MYNFLKPTIIDHLDDRTTISENIGSVNVDRSKKNNEKLNFDKDGYAVIKHLPGAPSIIKEPGIDVVYRVNSHGFRSDHFSELDKNSINILYAGCSWTFGSGLPEEYVWTSMLTEKIKKILFNKNVKSYNLGFPGFGYDITIKNIMSFIRSYGKPDYIFISMPDVGRKIGFDRRGQGFVKVFPNTFWLSQSKDNIHRKYTENYIYQNNLCEASITMHMFEDFCKEAKIKLIWSTWQYSEMDDLKHFEFNNFIHEIERPRQLVSPNREPQIKFYENIENLPFWQIAEDDAHPGTFWSTYISKLYFEKAIQNEFF